MIFLRDVIQYSRNGQNLIAEAKLTEEEFDKLRTYTLLDKEREFELDTVVYWWHGGNPPKPLYLDCPRHWFGRIVDKHNGIAHINVKTKAKWWLKYKPPTNSAGGAL